MKSTIVFPMCCLLPLRLQPAFPSAQVQIAGAVLAARLNWRDGAAVLGYDRARRRVWVREGKERTICLATDPTKTAFTWPATTRIWSHSWRGQGTAGAKNVTGAKRNEVRFKKSRTGNWPCEGSRDALCADRHKLRRRQREGRGLVPALGDLCAFATPQSTAFRPKRARARVLDVPRDGGRAHS